MSLYFFGGTFDPPHRGHLALVRRLLAESANAKVIIMPAAAPPLKDSPQLFPYAKRFRQLRALFALEISQKRVILSWLESRLARPNFTIHTLKALTAYCNEKPIIVIGADQAERLPRWHKIEELVLNYDFVVFARQGAQPVNLPGFAPRFIADFDENISSTEIRTALSQQNTFPDG